MTGAEAVVGEGVAEVDVVDVLTLDYADKTKRCALQ